MKSIAFNYFLAHNDPVTKTNVTGFDSSKVSRRPNRHQAVFLRPHTTRTFFGRAMVGRANALPVSVDAGLSTPLSARPPHLTVGSGSNQTTEVAMRTNILARPEQTQPLPITTPFEAGIQAAQAWFDQAKVSAATHRDNARCALVRAIADDSEAALASTVFNRGFAKGLELLIAERGLA